MPSWILQTQSYIQTDPKFDQSAMSDEKQLFAQMLHGSKSLENLLVEVTIKAEREFLPVKRECEGEGSARKVIFFKFFYLI